MPTLRGGTYPTSFGDKRASVMLVTGPASYDQFTAPSTGGQDVIADPQGGVKVVDWAEGGPSVDSSHYARVVRFEAGAIRGTTVTDAVFVLKWYVMATDAEVAGAFDLSGQIVRVMAFGEK